MRDRYAVIGNPVAHSKSPWIHAEFARATGQDIDYGRIEAPLGGFVEAVERWRREGGKGLNVTLPFKEEAFRYCAAHSARAQSGQAVNTIDLERGFGDNTDGVGLVRDLQQAEVELKGRQVLLMGAGGAARGVLGALLENGARVLLANRTLATAQALARRFGIAACSYAELRGRRFDVIVNATSAGLEDEAAPLPEGVLDARTLAYDMVYGRETPFLAAARAAGARRRDGLGMLVEQAAESFFLWRGVRPATRPVLERLRGA